MSLDDERSPAGGQQSASVVRTSSAPTRLRGLDPGQPTQTLEGVENRADSPRPGGVGETALAFLEPARRERSGWLTYLSVDPRLKPLRGQERFESLRPAGIRLVAAPPR